MALAVGILVDESTVTIENVHAHLSRGKSLGRAVKDSRGGVFSKRRSIGAMPSETSIAPDAWYRTARAPIGRRTSVSHKPACSGVNPSRSLPISKTSGRSYSAIDS